MDLTDNTYTFMRNTSRAQAVRTDVRVWLSWIIHVQALFPMFYTDWYLCMDCTDNTCSIHGGIIFSVRVLKLYFRCSTQTAICVKIVPIIHFHATEVLHFKCVCSSTISGVLYRLLFVYSSYR